MPIFDITQLSRLQEVELQAIIKAFPKMLERAVSDWAKFKLGVKAGLFTVSAKSDILSWFKEFPKLWETIRPNFNPGETPVMMLTPGDRDLLLHADKFVSLLGGEIKKYNSLGIAPLIIAGIAVAGAFGIAGAIWSIGYFKKQSNISKMIDSAVAGKLPPDILKEAVHRENQSVFGGLFGSVKWIALAGAFVMFWPYIQKLLPRVGAK